MSLEITPSGEWRVRWRTGGKAHSKVIGTKQDARLFEAEMKRAKRMGTLAHLEMGKDNFGDFALDVWFPRQTEKLAKKTQKDYANIYDSNIAPYLGHYSLAEITVDRTEEWLATLERKGVGRVSQQYARSLVIQMLNKAVQWQLLATNPAAFSERPRYSKKAVVPPTPDEVEAIREALLNQDRLGDSVLVSVLAYAGLRPQEALSLCWSDIGDRTLLARSPKTERYEGKGYRSVTLWAPLKADLAAWKLATGGKPELVFPNKVGRQWTTRGYANWRRRVWYGNDPNYKTPGAFAEGARRFPPKDCRHLFCSLMVREDSLSLGEQAQQAGHSISEHLKTYAHVLDELKGTGSAEDAIRAARTNAQRSRESA